MVIRCVVGCLIALTCTFWAAAPASAEISLRAYRALTAVSRSESMKSYVIGLGRGVVYAFGFAAQKNGVKLFCPPGKMNFDGDIIASLLDQEIREPASGVPWEDDAHIELIMVYAFLDRFPCKK
jgi:hypothetical protein